MKKEITNSKRKNNKKKVLSTLLSVQLLGGALVSQEPLEALASSTAPIVQVLNPVTNSQQVLGKTMLLTGTATDQSSTFTIKYQIDSEAIVSGQTFSGDSSAQSFKVEIPIPQNFSTGTHSLKVWAEDSDENKSPVKDIAFEVNTYAPPSLSGSQVNNHAQLEWATDILDEDVLVSSSLEEGHELPRLVYNSSNGMGAGGQEITDEDSFTGDKSYKVDTTTDRSGNLFNYPSTYSNSSHSYWSKKYIPNGTPISVSFRAKTTDKASISFYGGWVYGLSFMTVNEKFSAIKTDVYVTETAPAGQNWIKVSDIKGFGYGTHITTDTDPNKRVWNSYVKEVDIENNILILGSKLNKTLEPGHVLMARPTRSAWSFGSKSITSQDGWTLLNVNTTVRDFADVDWLIEGANLRHNITSTGNTYIDDLKFGYASETFLYRDGQQIYRGYGSSYDDKSATDKAKPNAVKNVTTSVTKGKATIGWDKAIDEGTTYNYTAKAIGHSGTETPISQNYPVTVSSGVKGYSVTVDKNPSTIPDNTVDTTTNSFNPSEPIDGSFYVHVATVDNDGNVSDVTHYQYDDGVAPSVEVTSSNTNLTNGDVVLTVNATDEKSGVYRIQLPDGTWVEKNNALFTVSENGEYNFIVEDHAGNQTTKKVSVQNIDKLAPSLTVTPNITEWTNESVQLNVVASDAETGVERIQLPDGTWVSGNKGSFTVKENGNYQFIAIDKAGNSKTVSHEVSNIDSVVPSGLRINAVDGWTNNEPTVSLVVDGDIPSGIKKIEYKLEGSAQKDWSIYQDSFKITHNGITNLFARMTSNSGTISDVITKEVKVDTEKPSVQTTISEENWTNSSVTIDLQATDSVSGVSRIKMPNGSYAYSNNVSFTTTENGSFTFEIEDNAGNKTTKVVEITNIDREAPIATVESSKPSGWTKEDVLVTLKIVEDDSDVKQVHLPNGEIISGSSLSEDKTFTLPLSKNGKYSFKVEDFAGNTTTQTIDVSNIDKESPSVTASVNTTEWNNQSVTIFLNAHDLLSGVESITLPNGNVVSESTISYKVNGNGTYTFVVKDNVGNNTEKTISVKNIDKTAPTLNLSVNTEDISNNVLVNVKVDDQLSGVEKVILPNGKEELNSEFDYPVDKNGTLKFTAVDKVGNQITKEIEIQNVDNSPPNPATVTASTTSLTNEDVTVFATFPQDAVTKQYKVGDGEWIDYSTEGITLSENNTVQFRSLDGVGNMSEVVSYQVDNIDKIAPDIPKITPSNLSPSKTSLDVSISYSADSIIKQYRINDGAWTAYTGAVVIEDNANVEARSFDEIGNESPIASYQITSIDKTPPNSPVVTVSTTNPTNQNVTASIEYPSDANIKQYQLKSSGVWNSYTAPLSLSQNDTLIARSIDEAGNISEETIVQVSNIDKVKPQQATITSDITAPTNQNVNVTAIFPTDVVKKEVRIGSKTWMAYEKPIEMTSNGIVEFRGYDTAGNVSDVSSYQVNNIDKIAPDQPSISKVENQNTITLTGDGDSQLYYRLNNQEWKQYVSEFSINDGEYLIDVKARDEAGNETLIQSENALMYGNALTEAEEKVEYAEKNVQHEHVTSAFEKVELLPHTVLEYQPLSLRVKDLKVLLDAQDAIEKATTSRNEEDVKVAQEKITLLNNSNPIILDLMDEVQTDYEEADILALIAKERYDILSTRYDMSKVSYTALVQVYYAIKYTGDFMYKYAGEKVALVPSTDKHYDFVNAQYDNLNVDYDQHVQDRVQTDAEIKAESSVKVMEGKYDPTLAVNTQKLIDAVEDTVVRESLQVRLDTAKAKYEAGQLDKASQEAIASVEKAESTKQSYYVSEAYKKVDALTDEALKEELTTRLQELETQIAYERQVADATRTVELAELYKYDSYITSAQNKVSNLPDGQEKVDLQKRLDALKAGLPSVDQAQIIKTATNYVSLAQSLKTQYYVDKAQGYVNQVIDEVKKAELQAKLDAIVIK